MRGFRARSERGASFFLAAVLLECGIQIRSVRHALGYAHNVFESFDGREVDNAYDILAVRRLANEGYDVLRIVVHHYPLEPVVCAVELPHRLVFEIESVEVFHKLLEGAVARIIKQEPVELLGVIPFDELRELVAHKVEFLAGVSHHKAVKRFESLELLVVVARHFVYHTALAVYDFVVGNGKNVIFAVSKDWNVNGEAVTISVEKV